MYVTVLVIFLAGFLLIYRIINSPFGEVLKAIRENEARAISLGYKTDRYKLMAFVLSATFAGLAGATKAIVFQLASLTDVDWPMSGEVVLMTLVGGLGTVFGPVVGAFVVIAMQNYLAGSRPMGAWSSRARSSCSACCCSAAASSANWRTGCGLSYRPVPFRRPPRALNSASCDAIIDAEGDLSCERPLHSTMIWSPKLRNSVACAKNRHCSARRSRR